MIGVRMTEEEVSRAMCMRSCNVYNVFMSCREVFACVDYVYR